nr:MAG TPA: hypothetical protein [Caudoviricetes sp.]
MDFLQDCPADNEGAPLRYTHRFLRLFFVFVV